MVRGRFPRPRGDGPSAVRVAYGCHGASGFPAHAGMDLTDSRGERPTHRRFPRPRGDGPLLVGQHPHAGTPSSSTAEHATGFPAHAGMDPARNLADRIVPNAVVSPPTRGWTRDRARPWTGPERWFPRPRGDGPTSQASCLHVLCCPWFPRPRGDGPKVDRPWSMQDFSERFPRPRGDGPDPDSVWTVRTGCPVSPPTRGWTHRRVSGLSPAVEVSPPTRGWTGRFRCDRQSVQPWFPRPRGDGPAAQRYRCRPRKVSPPTRGWTSSPFRSASLACSYDLRH